MKRDTALKISLLLVMVLIAYFPIFRGGYIWDDDDYVTQNANLRSLDGLANIWIAPTSSPQYYPMVFTTFWIEYHLWGLHPLGYHIVNVLLHAISVILVWRVLTWLDFKAAFLAAALFAVHPVMVESVAWITERKNVLSTAFYLCAALVYLRAVRVKPGTQASRRGIYEPGLYFLAIVLFIAALLSKTVTCSLPAALLLILWWKRGKLAWRDIWPTIPMFIAAFAMALFTAHFERTHVLAVGNEWNFTPIQRILIAGRAVWFYAVKLVVPINLSFVYPKWPIETWDHWAWIFPIAVVIALFVPWRMRDRWGRGPAAAALFFVGTLIPALGFFNIYPMRYTFVADHYQYLASLGVLTLIAFAWDRLPRSIPVPFCNGILIAPLIVLTMLRATVFADAEKLWRDAEAKNLGSWMVHLNLARTLNQTGHPIEAQSEFQIQVALGPNVADTHWNLGSNLLERGELDQAIAEFDRALAIDPTLAQVYYARGLAYLAQQKRSLAEGDFQHAVDLKPDYAVAHNALGELLVARHSFARAIEEYHRAIQSDPDLAQAHMNLAAVLNATGNHAAAQEEFDRAVAIDPSLGQYEQQVLGKGR